MKERNQHANCGFGMNIIIRDTMWEPKPQPGFHQLQDYARAWRNALDVELTSSLQGSSWLSFYLGSGDLPSSSTSESNDA